MVFHCVYVSQYLISMYLAINKYICIQPELSVDQNPMTNIQIQKPVYIIPST